MFRSQAVTDRSAESRTGIPEGRVQAEVAKQPRDPKPSCVRHLTSHADLTLTPIHHHTHTSTPFLHPLQRHRAVAYGHSHFHHVPSRRCCVANTALGRDTSSSGNRPPLAYLTTPPGDFIPARAQPRPSQPHPPSRKRPTASQRRLPSHSTSQCCPKNRCNRVRRQRRSRGPTTPATMRPPRTLPSSPGSTRHHTSMTCDYRDTTTTSARRPRAS